jgi:hypothetical protein
VQQAFTAIYTREPASPSIGERTQRDQAGQRGYSHDRKLKEMKLAIRA